MKTLALIAMTTVLLGGPAAAQTCQRTAGGGCSSGCVATSKIDKSGMVLSCTPRGKLPSAQGLVPSGPGPSCKQASCQPGVGMPADRLKPVIRPDVTPNQR